MEHVKGLKDREREIIEQINAFEDWNDRYFYIMELAKQLPPFDEQYQTETYEISGCQSRTWLYAKFENGKVYFYGQSDAQIIKGLLYILIYVYSGSSPDEIIQSELTVLKETGLQEHLSPIRSNGIAAIIKQMKLYAMAFSIQQKNQQQ